MKKNNKILISSRPPLKIFSGFYEFPGGKVEKNEFLLEALKREINEELNLEIDLSKIFFLTSYSISINKKKILLTFFLCTKWSGQISNLENQEIKWVKIDKLSKIKMLKSNEKVIDFLDKNF